MVTLTIDGKEVTVPSGTLIIRAAEQLGIEIPRFCDHPLLDPVGACRQCYVEIEGQRKLFTSCTTTVAPGMVVMTQNTSPQVEDAQVANLEFLLLNHPLDCPICDRGGECPLQDQALAFGPGESRYIEAKRTYPKPLALSPLVGLDRERCVLCARCTRFCDQISGDRFIELFDRGAGEQVSIAPGEDFRSPFSGNTVQICPVGALTATPYRFVARPFDLSSVDTICPHCSAGCNIKLDMRRGEVVRQLARDNLEVNDAWLCDKGRFAFRFPDAPDRVTTPLIRDHGLEPASFGEVLTEVAGWCAGKRVAFLTGGRLMDEDYYALSKLARTVFGTNDLDHRRDEGARVVEEMVASRATRAEPVTYDDVERAKVILVAGLDAEQEVPILHLRLRKAARRGAKIFVLHPRRTRLHDVAEHILCRPGDEAWLLETDDGRRRPEIQAVVDALREAGDAGLVIAGPRLADHATRRVGRRRARREDRARGSRTSPGVPTTVARSWRVCIRQLLPGGRRFALAEERTEVESLWGPIIVGDEGRNWWGILQACADAGHRRAVPDRCRPAPRLSRRRAGHAGAAERRARRSCSRSSSARSSRTPTRSSRRPRSSRRTDTSRRGRGAASGSGRSAARRASRCPDWEIFASLALAVRRRPRLRDARRAARRDGPAAGASRAARSERVADTGASRSRSPARASCSSSRTPSSSTRAGSPSVPTS